MTDFDNTNRGILGVNDRKTKDSQPGYTGTINVEGVEYFLDAWLRPRKDGTGKFFSLALKRKDKQPQQAQRQAPASRQQRNEPRYDNHDQSDVPF